MKPLLPWGMVKAPEPGNYVGCGASRIDNEVYHHCQLPRDHQGQHMAVIAAFKDEPEQTLWWKWQHQRDGKRQKWAEQVEFGKPAHEWMDQSMESHHSLP